MMRLLTTVVGCLITVGSAWGACSNPEGPEGHTAYLSGSRAFAFCDGTNWRLTGVSIPTAASTGCSNPAKPEGDVIFNGTYNVMQFCNGEHWVNMGPERPGAADTGCSNPADIRGATIYNSSANWWQYCNGQDWVNAGQVYLAGKPIWSPSNSSGLVLWLDGSDTARLFQDTDCSVTAGNGDAVACWHDKSTSSNHSRQSTVGNRPILTTNAQNGLTALNFGASLPHHLESDSNIDLTDGLTIIIVANNNTRKNYNGLFRVHSNIGGTSFLESYWQAGSSNSGNIGYVVNRNIALKGLQYNNAGPTAGNAYQYMVAVNNSSVISQTINGSLPSLSSGGVGSGLLSLLPSSSGKYFVGVGFGSGGPTFQENMLNGSIMEIIVYDTALVIEDRQKLEGYLGNI